MKKKLYKIKIWANDCILIKETDKHLTEDETNNFKVVKPYRGTIEEVKTTNPKDPKETKTKNVLGQTFIEW